MESSTSMPSKRKVNQSKVPPKRPHDSRQQQQQQHNDGHAKAKRRSKRANGERKQTTENVSKDNKSPTPAQSMICSLCGFENAAQNIVNLCTNTMMRQTLISFWSVPPKDVDIKLSSLCVQCVYKINAHREVTRSLHLQLFRPLNGVRAKSETKLKEEEKQTKDLKPNETSTQPPANASLVTQRHSVAKEQKSPPPNEVSVPKRRRTSIVSTTSSQTDKSTEDEEPPVAVTRRGRRKRRLATIISNPIAMHVAKSTAEVPKRETRSRAPPLVPERKARPRRKRKLRKLSTSPLPPELKSINMPGSPSACSVAGSSSSHEAPTSSHESMLQVVREQSEPTVITESGGVVNKYKALPQQCTYCERLYTRRDHFSKHMRRCQARFRAASMRSLRSQADPAEVASTACDGDDQGLNDNRDKGHSNTASDGGGIETVMRTKRRYHCTYCPVTVRSMKKLREHRRIHLSHLYCDLCGEGFTTEHDFQFHRAVCEAKSTALKEITGPASKAKSTRVTRSRSRAPSRPPSAFSTHGFGSYMVGNQDRYRFRSRSRRNHGPDSDEEDDAISVPDTMFTRRMRFTGHWLEEQSNSSSSKESYFDESIFDYDEDLHITSWKELDLYLLDRLKAEEYRECVPCKWPNCSLEFETLFESMIHYYILHYSGGWFHCKKCNRVFTHKVFYDYHVDRQNNGRYVCFRCGEVFEFQHHLDRHLIRHTKSVNYRCNYCKFEFLTETDLLNHCEVEDHDPNAERLLIRIDHAASIVNNDAPQPEPIHRADCTITYKELNLPHIPLDIMGKTPYRPIVGDIQYRGQRNPNCGGWR